MASVSTRPMNRSWSPAENVSTTVHSRVAIAPSISGRPVSPGCQGAPQNRSRPGVTGAPAKQSDSACWSSDRMFTPNRPEARTIGVRNRRRSSATITSGGSSETELRALTVMPNGRSPSKADTTVTPVTKWPITRRKTSGSIDDGLCTQAV